MIAGLESVTQGRIRIGTRDVTDLDPKDRDIAMVFQNYALYPHMTVAANMGFSLEHRGRPRPRSRSGCAGRPASWAWRRCSNAIRASSRAASASAWPWAGPSCATRRSSCSTSRCPTWTPSCAIVMRGEIKALHQKLKTTTVYVTHDQVEAMTMADRIVVLNAGRVEQVGAPLELFDRPANLFVAGFIGSPAMNFIPGRCTSEGFAAAGGLLLPMPEAAAHAGRESVCGVRPEHLEPCAACEGVPAQVLLVETAGLRDPAEPAAGRECR
jgi:multiple sugar transport system ATP-binding protein